jgi:hypothetical protein
MSNISNVPWGLGIGVFLTFYLTSQFPSHILSTMGYYNFKTRTFDDGMYWSPFRPFLLKDCRELAAWLDHYERLEIRTQLYNRHLWVHMDDDRAVYDRQMPARERL